MKNTLRAYGNEWAQLCEYVRNYRWPILLSWGLLLCVYLPWLVAPELHMDLDVLVMNPGTDWAWTGIGRQGYGLLTFLLDLEEINPYFICLFGWLSLCAVSALLGFFCWRFGLGNPVFCAFLGLLTFISPIFVEQFYWYYRILPLAVGYVFCIAAAGLWYHGILKKNGLSCVLGAILSALAFMVYQMLVVAEITLIVVAFLALYRRNEFGSGGSGTNYFSLGCKLILLFIVSYAATSVITNVWFMGNGGFSTSFIQWGQVPVSQCVESILTGIKNCVMGKSIHTTVLFSIFAGLGLAAVVIECVSSPGAKYKALYILAYILLQICPFLMSFYQGRESEIHIQLVYPMVMALDAAFVFGVSKRVKKPLGASLRVLAGVFAVVLFWSQAQTAMRMIYTDSVRIDEDKRVAADIERAVDLTAGGDRKPVIFIGRYVDELNPSCVRGDYIGVSALGWDHWMVPHYVSSSTRTAGLLNTLGMDFQGITDESAAAAARKKALDMPAWPAEGSIVDGGDCVIVKLSEDEWPEEVLETKTRRVDKLELPVNSGVRAVVDGIDASGENLVIKGWIDQSDNKKATWKPHIYLLYDTDGVYEIAAVKAGREALLMGGEPCTNNGFTALAELSSLPADWENCSMVFVYEDTLSGAKSLCIPSITAETSLGGPKAGLPGPGESNKVDLPSYRGYQYGVPVSIDEDGGVVSDGGAGAVIYGPYSETLDGVYNITVNYTVLSYTDSDRGTFDIALDARTYASEEFSAQEKSVTLENVALSSGHSMETRVWVPEGMVICVQSIEYQRIE